MKESEDRRKRPGDPCGCPDEHKELFKYPDALWQIASCSNCGNLAGGPLENIAQAVESLEPEYRQRREDKLKKPAANTSAGLSKGSVK